MGTLVKKFKDLLRNWQDEHEKFAFDEGLGNSPEAL
jgi:hypothetical protein